MVPALTRAAAVAVGISSILLGSQLALADDAPTSDPTKVPAAKPSSNAAGISLGLRVAWAFPIGSLASGESLSSNYNGMLPVWFDLGYRLNPSWYVGGYFQWAAAFVNGDLCPSIISCSATDLRFGANVHWHFLAADPSEPVVDPWVGLGVGYEIATTHIQANNSKAHETNRGFEYVNAQVGADYMGFAPLRLGAFGALTVAEFGKRSVSVPSGSDGDSVANPAVHLWAMLGLRGQYDF